MEITIKEIRETIAQEVIDCGDQSKEMVEAIGNFVSTAAEAYVLVEWPDVQDLMEEEWFEEEAVLNVDGESSYFVPLKRLF